MTKNEKNISRRDFLKTSGIATGALLGGGLIGGLVGYNTKKEAFIKPPTTKPIDTTHLSPKGRMFFTKTADFNILAQATERIFPKDELGPGAIDLGVPYFIDNQLAGSYGANTREYMQGPFAVGTPMQGYQSALKRSEIFKQGINVIRREAKIRFNEDFVKLEGEQMDEILTDLQKGETVMNGVSSSLFFNLLRSATLEGAYSDPMYSGNANMEAWKMKQFPGHQMSYKKEIDEVEFQNIKPQSLASMNH